MTVFLEFATGDLTAGHPDAAGAAIAGISPAGADTIAELAARAGVTGLRFIDPGPDSGALDPSLIAGYLAGRHPALSLLVDAPTTGNAPYNLARRLGSLDRASGGRTALVLRSGDGDEVSDAVAAETGTADRADRWAEYAGVVAALWESFPAAALLGDQQAGIVADDAQLIRIGHDGRHYRVRGPLDGPASRQGRLPLIAADATLLGYRHIAAHADAVVVGADELAAADRELRPELLRHGRPAGSVPLLLRVPADSEPSRLLTLREEFGFAGFVLTVSSVAEAVETLRATVPALTGPDTRPDGATAREALGVPVPTLTAAGEVR